MGRRRRLAAAVEHHPGCQSDSPADGEMG